jgi:hypothetical protein
MSGEVTYRSPKLCSDCWAPWSGLGPICNACKQISALKNLVKNSNTQSSSSSSNYTTLVLPVIVISLFFFFCYITNWIPLKFMWWFITVLVSAVWWILKVLFYLTLY